MTEMCCLDMDGVLVDFCRGALDAHGIQATVAQLFEGRRGTPYMQDVLGMPDAAFWEPMGEEFWAELEWMPDGQEILRLVEARFGQDNVVLCSTPSHNRGCWDGKRRWVERHMPRHYHKVHNQHFGGRKYMLANQDTWLVDDFDSNVDQFTATRGGLVCQVPRLWNRLYHLADCSSEFVREVLAGRAAA